MKDYVFHATLPMVEHGCMDVDNYAGVNLRDICRFSNFLYLGGQSPDCNPGPAPPLLNHPANQLIYNHLVPPTDTIVTLHLDVRTAVYTQGVSLVLRVFVDGETAEFRNVSVVTSNTLWGTSEFGDSSSAEVPAGYLMGGATDFIKFGNPPPGRYTVAKADLKVSSSPQYREITVELTDWPPGDNSSMLVGTDYDDPFRLNHQPWVIDLTGDANNDRVLTAADVIWLVNYVFKAGKTPYPVPATGDVDCSASVTSSDIIKLVNHVFKSGSPPCDVASMCTINLDQWTCP